MACPGRSEQSVQSAGFSHATLTGVRADGNMGNCLRPGTLPCASPAEGFALDAPKWRNWQTRYIQGVVPVREWRFESSLRHHFLCLLFTCNNLKASEGTCRPGRGQASHSSQISSHLRNAPPEKRAETSPGPRQLLGHSPVRKLGSFRRLITPLAGNASAPLLMWCWEEQIH